MRYNDRVSKRDEDGRTDSELRTKTLEAVYRGWSTSAKTTMAGCLARNTHIKAAGPSWGHPV